MTSGGGAGGQADTIYIDVTARLDGFEDRMRELEQSAESTGERAGSRLGAAMSVGLGVAVTGAVALAGALTAVAASSFNLAQEAAQNVNEFQSKLGASREEAEKLGTVAEQVFGDNWTGSLTEAGEAVATVRKEIKGLADEDLRTVTGGVVAIAETFEQEQGSIAAAVSSLMEATGISAQEATDFITKGFQEGLDSSGDFLDTLNEYAPQFEKSKIGAGELFSLLETGAGKGALGTDKIADAFKEFGLTIVDVSDDSKDVYDELGLNQAKLVKGINDGSITQAQAFETVTNALAKVKGQADRTRIGAAIFGGAGEDFANGLTKLDLTKTSLKDLGGATDSLNKRYENFGNFFSAMSRQIQVALLPVGKELLSLANDAMPYLQKAASWLGDRLPGWIKTGIDAVKQFGTGAVNTYNSVKPVIEQVGVGVQKLSSFLEKNKEILIPLAAGISAGAAAYGVYRVATIAATVATTAWTTVTTLATAASVGLRAALTFITGPVGLAIAAITLLVAGGVALYRNWDDIKAMALAIWAQVEKIISNAMGGATKYLQSIDLKQVAVDIIMGFVNGIKGGAGLVLNAVKGLGSTVINGIKGVLNIQSPSRVMEQLGAFTGQGFAKGIESEIPRVQKAAQETGKAFLDALGELKLEKAAGRIDIDVYARTLEKARDQLRSTLGTVKEGTPAYGEWLRALAQVTGELDSLKGKSGAAQEGAKKLADELGRNRAQIVAGEQAERYAQGLRGATAAQLEAARAAAKNSGEVDKYNAIKSEQTRRENLATAATTRHTDAAKAAADQVRQARDAIVQGEQMERYVAGLRSATAAQLDSALTTARARGETEKYNAIRGEQNRREGEAQKALDASAESARKLADATRQAAEQLVANRKAILDGQAWESYVESLKGYSDELLDAARNNALAAGDGTKFNAVLTEQRQRADDAAKAVSDLVDLQIKENALGYQKSPEAATDSAYQQSYGFGDAGLIRSLAGITGQTTAKIRGDVLSALEAVRKFAPDTAKIIERVYEDALAHRKSVTAEQARVMEQAAKDEEERIQRVLAAHIAAAEERRARLEADAAEELRLNAAINASHAERSQANLDLIKNAADASEDAGVTVGFLTGLITDLIGQGLDPKTSGYLTLLDDLEKQGGKAGAAAAQVKKNLDELILAARFAQATPGALGEPVAARGTPVYEIAPEDPKPAEPLAPNLLGGKADLGLAGDVDAAANLAAYRAEIQGLTDDQLELAKTEAIAAQDRTAYNALVAESAQRTAELSKETAAADAAHETWLTNLERIEQGEWVASLKKLSDAELQVALEAARAAEDVTAFNAVLAQIKDREINVTFKIGGVDTGIKKLDMLKIAADGITGFIKDTFSALASGASVSAGSVVKSFAIMALGVVEQIATMIAAQAALIAVTALIDSSTLNPRAILTLVAAAAVAGIAAGFKSKLSQQQGSAPAASAASTSGAPIAQAAAQESSISIPTSQVTVMAAPEWVSGFGKHVDRFGELVDRFGKNGVRVLLETESSGGGNLAYDLTTGGV